MWGFEEGGLVLMLLVWLWLLWKEFARCDGKAVYWYLGGVKL